MTPQEENAVNALGIAAGVVVATVWVEIGFSLVSLAVGSVSVAIFRCWQWWRSEA